MMSNQRDKIQEKKIKKHQTFGPLTFEVENGFTEKGYEIIAGCDEAGRGPLCGPVVAAAVILPSGMIIPELNDSKKLTEKKRGELFEKIKDCAVAWVVAEASVAEIDALNIRNASMLAMNRAVSGLSVVPSLVLVDGNYASGFSVCTETVIHGDAISPNIAAASVIAKVTRDRICEELDKKYPGYGIAKHKGYPTKAHYEELARLGPSDCHRRSFRLE